MTRTRSLLAAGILALAALLLLAPAARAASIDEIGASLRSGDPVYVEPGAEDTLSPADADQLRQQVRATGVPMYIAVLTTATAKEIGDGSPNGALKAVHDEVGLAGVYGLYAGNAFRAASTGPSVTAIASAVDQQTTGQGAAATLTAFVAQVGSKYGKGSGLPGNPASVLVPLGIAAVVLGGGGFWLYRRSKATQARRTAEVRRTIDEDVTEYGERVSGLDVDDPQLGAEGRADAQRALDAYETAKSASAAMTRPEDAATVTAALEDGRFATACVEARRAGTALPERRPPCFVDPRHGPSVKDVDWAPDGGAPRPIPVCASCAVTLEDGRQPAAREVEVGGRRMPYWQAGGAYQPYATGYFGANLLPALLVGSMFAGGLGGGAPEGSAGDAGWDGGWGGGGDFGGGGGDFGGGDFGGGGDF